MKNKNPNTHPSKDPNFLTNTDKDVSNIEKSWTRRALDKLGRILIGHVGLYCLPEDRADVLNQLSPKTFPKK